MIARSLILSGLATFLGVLTAGAGAAPGINPTGDSFVGAAVPGNNYGKAGALEISANSSNPNGEYDTFVRFNLASTVTYFNGVYGAGNWTVQSITLTLTTSAPNNAIFNANAAGAFSIQLNNSDAWVEGTGTPALPDTTATDLNYTNHTNYESPSDPSLGMFSFAGGTSGTNTFTLTLASGFLADVQSGSDATMYFAAADNVVSYLFNSTNFGTAGSRSLLVVNAVPEPGTGVLVAGGVGGLLLGAAGQRRRRHG